jgi:stalled ribosome alternative rescue factor ArfA
LYQGDATDAEPNKMSALVDQKLFKAKAQAMGKLGGQDQ